MNDGELLKFPSSTTIARAENNPSASAFVRRPAIRLQCGQSLPRHGTARGGSQEEAVKGGLLLDVDGPRR